MEKQAFLDESNHPSPTNHYKPRRSARSPLIPIALLALTFYVLRTYQTTWLPSGISDISNDIQKEPLNWEDIPSKPYLEYHDCHLYDSSFDKNLKCARLEVPMDYWNGTTNATTSIAVVKKPASVPVTDANYGGPILFNPGGPGGSGVFLVAYAAESFRQVIEPEDGKHFDYIGFDPRGVGLTRPFIRCYDDILTAQTWAMRMAEQGVMGASDAAFGRLWSMTEAETRSCLSRPIDGEAEYRKYVSTASVARDMVEIIERHGEWREKEAERILNGDMCPGRRSRDSVAFPETLKHQVGKEKINYWGFSYGTYLGNTFAAMFPDRINRLIVDGVVDAYDYKKTLWSDNLVDTEKDLDLFYHHCARVGWPTCPLANELGMTTLEGVKNRTYNILQSLYHNPLPLIKQGNPEVFTYSDIKFLIFSALYNPIAGFPLVAGVLLGVEKGDIAEWADFVRWTHHIWCPEEDEDGEIVVQGDATPAIACTDGDDQSWVTKDLFEDYIANLTRISPAAGDIWASLRLSCIHYSVRPNHRFEGPWVAKTSHPILEIGNTADPVTPGRYAKKMAKGFEGAVALIQDSGGHCSLAAPSNCTQSYVRQYFQTGELPPPDTICDADYEPFGPTPGDESVLDVETKLALERQTSLAKALYRVGGGHMAVGAGARAQQALLAFMG